MSIEANKIMNLIKAKHEYVTSNKMTITDLNETLDFYESTIPEFFSSTGEAEGIRKMYHLIREGVENNKEKKIIVNDINNLNS